MRDAQEGSMMILFMADNLFISQKIKGKIKWISLDGEKMECSHSRADVKLYLNFFHRQYENVDPKTWEAYEAIALS